LEDEYGRLDLIKSQDIIVITIGIC
jgi:hypothetical protein